MYVTRGPSPSVVAACKSERARDRDMPKVDSCRRTRCRDDNALGVGDLPLGRVERAEAEPVVVVVEEVRGTPPAVDRLRSGGLEQLLDLGLPGVGSGDQA